MAALSTCDKYVIHVQLQICNTDKFMHALTTDHPGKKVKPIQKCIKKKNNSVQSSEWRHPYVCM